ncbi:MAG: ABC transporter substrate-binding protein [Dehalococcoidia bacterium]|nr:ABC transporter substrate-binding protein [Dehalococcoidia bacterium]
MIRIRRSNWTVHVVLLVSLFLMACGAAATPTTAPALATPTPMSSDVFKPTPTAAAKPTTAPTVAAAPAKNTIVLVTSNEPASMNNWTTRCASNLAHTMCGDTVNEPLTWIDSKTFEVVPLSTVERWEQVEPNRWRFTLRKGVKYHNGEEWNAEAAKVSLDVNGDSGNGLDSFSYTGAISGQVVDPYTVDVVCKANCPILARGMLFSKFQAPAWYKTATPEERARKVISLGPYKQLEWRSGIDIKFEANKDYLPNKAFDAQAPTIRNVTQTWRAEALVRSAMVTAGEADWAEDIGFENQSKVPAAKVSGTTEVYAAVLDTMWHPELKKQKVRLALAHAIDCEAIAKALYGGVVPCLGSISVKGTIGITERNSKPRDYNPTLAKQLLKEAGYDPANKINLNVQSNRVFKDLEFMEAVARYFKEVGVATEFNALDLSKYTDVRSSGCGQFTNVPGYKEALDCASRVPPAPISMSSHIYTTSTSNEVLDMNTQGNRRLGCFNVNSRVCYADLQKKIDIASATPSGPERVRLWTEVADIAYDEVYFIPFFHNQMVYGMAKNLDWEPLYSPRLRVNTMKFK